MNLNSGSNSNLTGDSADTCENCSSNFSIFKRRKVCNLCKQSFCQSCVNRQSTFSPLNNSNRSSTNNLSSSTSSYSSSSDRICVICQAICSAQTTTDDLMKMKLKHLRSFLSASNIPMTNCKDKRDIAELVMSNRAKISNSFFRQPRSASASNTSGGQQQQPQSGSSFNDTINSFMNNVQEFVNFNLNSAFTGANGSTAANENAGGSTANTQNANQANTNRGFARTDSTSSTNNNNSNSNRNSTNTGVPSQPSANARARDSTTSTSTSSSSSSIPSNINSLFNLIGEQVPNVLQQTFNFSNVFGNSGEAGNGSAQPAPPNASTTQAQPQAGTGAPGSSFESSRWSSSTQPPSSGTNRAPSPPPSAPTANNPSPNEAQAAAAPRRRASLSDIRSEEDIDNLNIKQIKEILALNFVEYKGCCEKRELVDKVKRLYSSHLENKRLERELIENDHHQAPSGASSAAYGSDVEAGAEKKRPGQVDEFDLCKICMESLIDCVLLECGHMVACTKCGKRLAECPICRQNVVRVIRVFKS